MNKFVEWCCKVGFDIESWSQHEYRSSVIVTLLIPSDDTGGSFSVELYDVDTLTFAKLVLLESGSEEPKYGEALAYNLQHQYDADTEWLDSGQGDEVSPSTVEVSSLVDFMDKKEFYVID